MLLRTFLIVLLAVFNIALLGKVIWGQTGLLEYKSLKQQLAELQTRSKLLDIENLNLSNEIRMLKTDNNYMEKVIRRQLHFLRDNEIVYIFEPANTSELGVKENERKN